MGSAGGGWVGSAFQNCAQLQVAENSPMSKKFSTNQYIFSKCQTVKDEITENFVFDVFLFCFMGTVALDCCNNTTYVAQGTGTDDSHIFRHDIFVGRALRCPQTKGHG